MATSPEVLIFTDLDDSLFSTLRKIPESQRADLTIAARAAGGKDSYMNQKQLKLLDWMDVARCIPVTARGTEAYSRVVVPFAGPAAIVANGAVILDKDGTINTRWAEKVANSLSAYQERVLALPSILTQLATDKAMNIRTWAVMEPSCGAVYAVAKSNDSSDGEGLDSLLESFKHHGANNPSHTDAQWQFHINGNNLSIMPGGINKAAAVRYLLTQLDAESAALTVGVGDSKSDLAFMRLCDVWLTPTRSQIDAYLHHGLNTAHSTDGKPDMENLTGVKAEQLDRQSKPVGP